MFSIFNRLSPNSLAQAQDPLATSSANPTDQVPYQPFSNRLSPNFLNRLSPNSSARAPDPVVEPSAKPTDLAPHEAFFSAPLQAPSQFDLDAKLKRFDWLMQQSRTWFESEKSIPTEDGKEVFNLIYWFRVNMGAEWNKTCLFDKARADSFFAFLQCLERGGVQELTQGYVENLLQQIKLSIEELKRQVDERNEASGAKYSIYYYIGFGRVSGAVRDKLRTGLKKIEERENGSIPAPAPGGLFGVGAPAPAPAAPSGLNSMNGMNTGLNSMNGMNTGAPFPFTAQTPHTATATALRTPVPSSAVRPSRLFTTHRGHSQYTITNPTPGVKTPALPTNRQAVENVMTGHRSEELLFGQTLTNFDQEAAGAFVGENKLDDADLLGLRKGFDPTSKIVSNRLEMKKELDKIRDQNDDSFKDVDRKFVRSEQHASKLPFQLAISDELQIVEGEKLAYSKSVVQVEQTVKAVSASIARAIENVDHDAEEKVARLMREWEERQREWEERQRLHREAELQHDRDLKEIRREQEEKKETFRYKEMKYISDGDTLKDNFTKSFEEVKKANAARLAKSLALSQIDEDAHKLIQDAVKLRDPTEYTTEEEERAFEQFQTKFFQQLALVESNQSALVEQAYNTLYK